MQVCSCWFSGWCTCRRLLSHLPPAYLYMRPPAWGCFHNPLVITLYINIILINLFTLACTWFKVCFSFLFCQCIKLYRILSLLEWSLVIRHFFLKFKCRVSRGLCQGYGASVARGACVCKEISTFRFNRFAAVSRYEKVSKSVWCKSQQTESSLHICTFCKVLFLFGSTESFAPPLLVCTSLIICDSEDLAPNISDAVSPLVEACTWFKVYFFLPGRVLITLYINSILINLFTLACTWFKVCFSFLFVNALSSTAYCRS